MSNEHPNDASSRESYLFQHLVAMFQTLALQQMGKLMNPLSGEVERDLHQARITIDMLDMISAKTTGNLSAPERALLDGVLMELRMNFVDESSKPDEAGGDGTAERADGPAAEETTEEPPEGDSGDDTETEDET